MATTPQSPQVSLRTLGRGFDEAHGRLQTILGDPNMSPEEAFLPLFEALHWTVAISELAAAAKVSLSVSEADVFGLRHARNRAHHQWARP